MKFKLSALLIAVATMLGFGVIAAAPAHATDFKRTFGCSTLDGKLHATASRYVYHWPESYHSYIYVSAVSSYKGYYGLSGTRTWRFKNMTLAGTDFYAPSTKTTNPSQWGSYGYWLKPMDSRTRYVTVRWTDRWDSTGTYNAEDSCTIAVGGF